MEEQIRILSTKKLKEPLAALLQSRDDLAFTESDFIRIAPVPFELPVAFSGTGIAAIVFTSANAVKYAAAGHTHPGDISGDVFCLHGATQERAIRLFGAACICGTASDAAGLAQEIISRKSYAAVTFFCGEQRRDELPRMLRNSGINVHEVIVYTTIPTPQKTDDADAILFFSPSAVQSFFSLNQLSPGVTCFAVGATTAAAIRGAAPDNIIITAARASQEAVLEAFFNYFQRTSIEPDK